MPAPHIASLVRQRDVDLTDTYETADRLLTIHGQPDVPVDVRGLATQVGCEIIDVAARKWIKAPARLRELPALYDAGSRTILVNETAPLDRKNTGIAHELGHDQIPSQIAILRDSGISRERLLQPLLDILEVQARMFSFYLRLGGAWFDEKVRVSPPSLLLPVQHARQYGVSSIMALERYIEICQPPCVLRMFTRCRREDGQPALTFRRYIASAAIVKVQHPVPVNSRWPAGHIITKLALTGTATVQRAQVGQDNYEVLELGDRVYALCW